LAVTFLPNPICQLQDHEPPQRWGLSPERTIVGASSPASYFDHADAQTAILTTVIEDITRPLPLPALFLHGSKDRLTPPSCATTIASVTLGGRVQIYAGGHDEPGTTAMEALMLEFVSDVTKNNS
jgi:pimeloyl-ACP methyl ester carboxylesterase